MAVDMDWDYWEYRQGIDKNSRYEQLHGPAEAGGDVGESNKYRVTRPATHDGAIHHQLDNEEEEEDDFFDASVSLSPQHGAHGVDPNIRYDSLSDVGEIRVYQRADFQSGSRVLKKVF